MNTTNRQPMPIKFRASRAHLVLCLLALTSVAAAADSVSEGVAGTSGAERQRAYLQERQVCLSGASNQSREDCLREAGAALQPGGNTGVASTPAGLQANAEQRCAALPAKDKQSCLLRMQGAGSTQGSADAGGILRELTEPAQKPAP